MNTKIKIGQPHIYFRLKRIYNKYITNTENFLIVILSIGIIGLAFNVFLKADLTDKFAITTVFFLGTTVFLLMKNSKEA